MKGGVSGCLLLFCLLGALYAEKKDYPLLLSGRIVGQSSSSGTSYIGGNMGLNWGPISGFAFFPLFITYAGYSYDQHVGTRDIDAHCIKLGNETIAPVSLVGHGTLLGVVFGAWPTIHTELLYYPVLETIGFSGGFGIHSNFSLGVDFTITVVDRRESYGVRLFVDPLRILSLFLFHG